MTQADLAARTYLSRSTISRLETGASARVDLVQLSQLADVLDVGVGDLLPASSLVSLPPPRGARRRRASRTAQGADSLFTAAS